MRFPETKIRGTTWTIVKCLHTPKRKIPGKLPSAPIEPGGLIPVSVDGLAPDTENPAIIEWQTQYGTPPTLH